MRETHQLAPIGLYTPLQTRNVHHNMIDSSTDHDMHIHTTYVHMYVHIQTICLWAVMTINSSIPAQKLHMYVIY